MTGNTSESQQYEAGKGGGFLFVFALPILKVNLESNMETLVAKCVPPPTFNLLPMPPPCMVNVLKV